MTEARVLTPQSEAEAAETVREARSRRQALEIRGGGTRAGLGRPVEADAVLSSAALTGITLHEPSELVISARAGTPVRDLVAALDAQAQIMPVEPFDHRALYDASAASDAGEPTVGGLVATNASGPRRVQAGAIRDHLIGVRFVNGRGEVIKSGGRVMKNVTGLDLVKLQCGAHGTLGFLTEVTFKLLPKPQALATLVLRGLDDRRAVAALSAGLGSPFDVSGAAHLPPGPGRTEARTLLRLEGFSVAVEGRAPKLAGLLAEFGSAEVLRGEEAGAPWRDLCAGRPIAHDRDAAIWRASVPPRQGPALAEATRPLLRDHAFDWGGGLVWLATEASGACGAAEIRGALAKLGGGHATLVRAPAGLRRTIDVFQPLDPALRRMTEGVKRGCDPDGVLNYGRMYAGI